MFVRDQARRKRGPWKRFLWITCRIMSQMKVLSQLLAGTAVCGRKGVLRQSSVPIQREVHFWLFRKSAFGSHDARWQHLKWSYHANPTPSVTGVWPAIFEQSSRQQQVEESGMNLLTADLQGSAPTYTWSCKAHGHKAEVPKT